MAIRLSEHQSYFLHLRKEDQENAIDNSNESFLNSTEFDKYHNISSKSFNKSSYRFIFNRSADSYEIKADYCIGIDWIGNTGKFIYVEPKINSISSDIFSDQLDDENLDVPKETFEKTGLIYELDYLNMLSQVTAVPESNEEVKDLIQIDWDIQQIAINQQDDKLTPFLIVRFLQTLKAIVKKGLKKDYFKIQENLNNRIKGKILVGQHIKQNIYKNHMTSTYCEYQAFAEDHLENRFLKKVLRFVSSYVENNKDLFSVTYKSLDEAIRYCRPAFEFVSDTLRENELKHIKYNPFFSDYRDAIKIGGYILKRFAFNITQTSKNLVSTPPFWIDMPRLFELFVFSKMIQDNSLDKKHVNYQFSTYGNALDILVSKEGFQMIIDAKYKLQYQTGHLHQDIRQVAGYARLNKVRDKLNINEDRNIDCLIVYPDLKNGIDHFSLESIIQNREPIHAYHKVYKLGVKLPLIGL